KSGLGVSGIIGLSEGNCRIKNLGIDLRHQHEILEIKGRLEIRVRNQGQELSRLKKLGMDTRNRDWNGQILEIGDRRQLDHWTVWWESWACLVSEWSMSPPEAGYRARFQDHGAGSELPPL
ncbi:hypothetical protein KIL84_009669, partial [Mauremys mutica]